MTGRPRYVVSPFALTLQAGLTVPFARSHRAGEAKPLVGAPQTLARSLARSLGGGSPHVSARILQHTQAAHLFFQQLLHIVQTS